MQRSFLAPAEAVGKKVSFRERAFIMTETLANKFLTKKLWFGSLRFSLEKGCMTARWKLIGLIFVMEFTEMTALQLTQKANCITYFFSHSLYSLCLNTCLLQISLLAAPAVHVKSPVLPHSFGDACAKFCKSQNYIYV